MVASKSVIEPNQESLGKRKQLDSKDAENTESDEESLCSSNHASSSSTNVSYLQQTSNSSSLLSVLKKHCANKTTSSYE